MAWELTTVEKPARKRHEGVGSVQLSGRQRLVGPAYMAIENANGEGDDE